MEIKLTKEQKEIVEAELGPMLVTAGAGSGKTRVLTERVKFLADSVGGILVITFTNKAAKELKERLGGVQVEASTFHSFCARFLRKYISRLDGYTTDFSIYDMDDRRKLLKAILGDDAKEDLKNAEWHISNAKNGCREPDEYHDVYIEYQKRLRDNNALDFDDLLLRTLDVLGMDEILQKTRDKYKYVLVDEFQDTNIPQYRIVKLIAGEHRNVMVVGDEDQCIYTWRGASAENTNLFVKEFEPRIFKLEENFRSGKEIVDTASKLVNNNENRIKKVLFSNQEKSFVNCDQKYNEREEAQVVAEHIYREVRNGAKYSDFAVLMRINALSRHFEEQFLAYNIPHVIWGGFKFYERAEIKSTINYFRVLVNPRDAVAFFDVINFPRRGVGDASIEKIKEQGIESAEIPKKARVGVNEFLGVIDRLREMRGLDELADSFISIIGLDKVYDKRKEEDLSRLENIYQLSKAMKDFRRDNPSATISDWLQSVSLMTDQDEKDAKGENVNAVVISTVHSAKGLEFKTVFVVGLEDGLFPLARAKNSGAEMEEERRLLYVAITRARRNLFLSYCGSRFLHGKVQYCVPSGFLGECGFGSKSASLGPSTSVGMTSEKYKAKSDTVESLGFEIGDRVSHEKFGEGTVEAVIDKNIIKIKFDVVGVKMLSLAFATLIKLD